MSRLRSAMTKGKRVGLEMVETATPKRKRNPQTPPLLGPRSTRSLTLQMLSGCALSCSAGTTRSRERCPGGLWLTESDLNIRTYAVWVSEIMLQQTQVATVINYYNKWMKRWPTVQDLATATLEEVNQMWAGLGYYSRGRRLHEGAQKVVSELKGQMPRTVDSLLKQLPGVGRYTAAAVGSIALGQVSLANTLVDPERPGDFNQAMMELGARVCTPKGPLCSRCPVQSHCHSYHKPWDDALGVLNFPRKPAKKPPRVERTLTCVVIRRGEGGEDEFLLTQRPNKGLLAGLWEFPNLLLEEKSSDLKQRRALCAQISGKLGTHVTENMFQYVGEVVHIFSHIHQTYVVHSVCLKDADTHTHTENARWLSRSALQEAAVSTGVKKIVKLYDSVDGQKEQNSKDGKRQRHTGTKNDKKPNSSKKAKVSSATSGGRQLSLSSFFNKVKEEP
ncbi:hypothetical protein F7725_027464 [Dissostichus mawsoni]|uniref:Adenine DNA glycosylase n=1 Tax=Dissostichus mawsoni TaxID=36200 RepID=A0A7J5XCZ8_DISMA|nr:hypothetical protein F7725_027464 [Dissostichus mawsoni]